MPENTPNVFYVTTPIYYVNDKPHIGHVYTTTIADVLARYHRLRGDDVFFLTGTDEHATKVVDAAAERGLTTQQWADQNAHAFEDTFNRLGMTHDDFIRTSQQRHKDKVSEYVTALLASGDVYLGDYVGWYDAGQEEYVSGKKAEECNFISPVNKKPLVKKTEKNYFFRLSAYREQLLTLLEQGGEVDGQAFDVQPAARKNEIVERVRTMEDVPISRTGMTDWGIAVPGDDEHTIYVWIDALFNYLTTVDSDDRRHYWQSGALHLIAKDILWFHAAIWPALLLALRKNESYSWVNLPALIYSHSFWISEGTKMSKSLGNFIDLEKIDHYVETFGLDALKYFLATQGPMGTTDSDFAEQKFIETYNADLANTFGNSCSRVTNMIGKYFEGVCPAAGPEEFNRGGTEGAEEAPAGWAGKTDRYRLESRAGFESLGLQGSSDAARRLVGEVDLYIEQTAPFKLAKDPENLPVVGTILYDCLEALRIASVLLWPFIPDRCEAFWGRIGFEHYAEALKDSGKGDLDAWVRWGADSGGLKPGTPIEKGDALFPRYQPPKA